MPVLVEMGWGGAIQNPSSITWTDISNRVNQVRGVTITRGASDERSDNQPGQATLTLDNQDGALTPGNSASPYYPYVRRNAPIRITAVAMPTRSGSAPYPLAMLGDDFDDGRINTATWTTNVGGATETSGRLRIPLAPGVDTSFTSARQWTLVGSKVTARLAKVPAVNGSSNVAASMWVTSTTAGTRIGWRYDALLGVIAAQSQTGFADAGTVNLAYSPVSHAWLRVRESGGTVYWETSSNGYEWTTRRTLATPAWVTSQTHALEFPTTRTGGTTDTIEWDWVGAELRPRYWGVVNEFPVRWEGLVSTVTVTCTDLFKFLNRDDPLKSFLAEEILHQDVAGVTDILSAYYPLTEPAGSTSAGDLAGRGCGPLTQTQAGSGGVLEFGSEGLAVTGDTSVTFTPAGSSAGKYLAADLGPTFEATSTGYAHTIEFWVKTTVTSRAILGMFETNLDHQMVVGISAAGELTMEYTETGGSLTVHNTLRVINDDQWHHVVLDSYSNWRLHLDGVALGVGVFVTQPSGIRTLHVGGYRGSRLFVGQIAHLALMHADGYIGPTISPVHYAAATTGFAGETADERIERLVRYGGLSSVTIWGSTHDPVAGQGAGGSQALALMREIEATESARLFAERDWYGLAYQSRDVRYNPSPASEVFTIDYADLETRDAEMANDDQNLINIAEGSRPGGAVQKVSDSASIAAYGPYPPPSGAISLLKTSDNSVLDALNWLVSRYANPPLEIREVPIEAYTMASYLDILDADISGYFSIYNLPAQAPSSTIRVTIEGYTETIKENSHVIQFHTSASARDSVWILDDPVYGVLDSTTRLAY